MFSSLEQNSRFITNRADLSLDAKVRPYKVGLFYFTEVILLRTQSS